MQHDFGKLETYSESEGEKLLGVLALEEARY
jgi:hypothetical protein